MRAIVLLFILIAVARGAFLSFDFKPNTAQSIPNPLGSAINLKCTIKSTDASDVMVGKMVSGTGSVNGQTVPAGGISFTVKNGDVVALSGSGNSEVSITNQGSNLVHADCDLALASSNSFLSFDFKPNAAQSIPNPLGSTINLKCTIKSTDASDVMVGKMISGTGSVNGQTVPASGISFTVKNGDVISLSASASSEVSITNQGSNLVHADCDLALSESLKASNSFLSFDFKPNAAQNIPNPLGSAINLKCTLKSTDASDVMVGKMLSGTGSVNGQTVPASGLSFTIKNGDVISLSASASSEVSITNQGSNLVHADCDLALSESLKASNSFLSFDFKPNAVQNIPNPLGSAINLKCTLKSTDASDVMVGKMLSGTGSVNGQTVPASGLSFTIKNGDVILLSASASSEVSITNQGSNLVHADCDFALASSNSFLSFDFKPNAAQNIPNPLGSTISLKCTIKSTDASDVMLGKMLAGTGSVNGQSIPASGISFTVKNGDVVTLSGSGSSEISITNQGSNIVHVDCDLALSESLQESNSFLSFDFQANTAQSIPNPLGSAINLKCTIKSTDASDVMFGKMLSGTGSVNGQTVPASGISFTVKNGDVIALSTSASSEVSITNQGSNLVHADCDLASLDESFVTIKSFLSF